MAARDWPERSAQGVNGEPVTWSSREGVHLELQIKHSGLGPHGEALSRNGLLGDGKEGIGSQSAKSHGKSQDCDARFATPDDASVHLTLQ